MSTGRQDASREWVWACALGASLAALLGIAGCSGGGGSTIDGSVGMPDASIVHFDASAPGSDAGGTGHDSSAPAVDAASAMIDAGSALADAAPGDDAWIDSLDGNAPNDDAGLVCRPGTYRCECATGYYCLMMGAACLSPGSPCPH